MKVEAYLRAQICGLPIELNDLENAVISPMFAKPTALRVLKLTDDVEDIATDIDGLKALKYALSTLYYAVSEGHFGGSRSEKVGDVSISVSAAGLSASEKAMYRQKADALRDEVNADREAEAEQSGMFDGTAMRLISNKGQWR